MSAEKLRVVFDCMIYLQVVWKIRVNFIRCYYQRKEAEKNGWNNFTGK